MIKTNFGSITNGTGKSKDIIVSCLSKKNVKDILIGCGMALMGVAYMGISCFRNGAREFEHQEFDTMVDLGIIDSEVYWDGSAVVKEEPDIK